MSRERWLGWARRGLRAPLVTDLFLHEEPDPEAARVDGAALARVIARAAGRWGSPLGLPLMDLRLEKADLLAPLGLDADAADRFHLDGPLDAATRRLLLATPPPEPGPGSLARERSLAILARETDLLPVGMAIGPFSLATKLLKDPITPLAMLGTGVAPEEDAAVRTLLEAHEIAEAAVLRAVRRQLDAGARAVFVCEPTASTAFFSPRQLRAGATTFDRLVIEPARRLGAVLDAAGADLIFHDCGELVPEMIAAIGHQVHPAVLSLGSSRRLWDDAAIVPEDVVLYGNLPTKSFYSDAAMPADEVARRTAELLGAMARCGHPHILGSECDVLHVPEAAAAIRHKVEVMMTAVSDPLPP
jgi:hypothetical protein